MGEFADYTDRLDMREQLARIDNLLADTHKKQLDAQLAPWQVFTVLLGAAAGFFLAGAGFLRLLQ